MSSQDSNVGLKGNRTCARGSPSARPRCIERLEYGMPGQEDRQGHGRDPGGRLPAHRAPAPPGRAPRGVHAERPALERRRAGGGRRGSAGVSSLAPRESALCRAAFRRPERPGVPGADRGGDRPRRRCPAWPTSSDAPTPRTPTTSPSASPRRRCGACAVAGGDEASRRTAGRPNSCRNTRQHLQTRRAKWSLPSSSPSW